jgi:hypothetical protein
MWATFRAHSIRPTLLPRHLSAGVASAGVPSDQAVVVGEAEATGRGAAAGERSGVTKLRAKLLANIVVEDRGFESPCWIWTRSVNNAGYGNVRWNGRQFGAHRASYLAFKGPIPECHWALHKCDQRDCLRPDHIYLGLPVENVNDMRRKGRHPKMKERVKHDHGIAFATTAPRVASGAGTEP